MMNTHNIIRRPLVTEKGVAKKEAERTLLFDVDPRANKVAIRAAVEKLFKVKVEAVRTANQAGKIGRRGRFSGYRPDWKKAYVKLKPGEKTIEFFEGT